MQGKIFCSIGHMWSREKEESLLAKSHLLIFLSTCKELKVSSTSNREQKSNKNQQELELSSFHINAFNLLAKVFLSCRLIAPPGSDFLGTPGLNHALTGPFYYRQKRPESHLLQVFCYTLKPKILVAKFNQISEGLCIHHNNLKVRL